MVKLEYRVYFTLIKMQIHTSMLKPGFECGTSDMISGNLEL